MGVTPAWDCLATLTNNISHAKKENNGQRINRQCNGEREIREKRKKFQKRNEVDKGEKKVVASIAYTYGVIVHTSLYLVLRLAQRHELHKRDRVKYAFYRF